MRKLLLVLPFAALLLASGGALAQASAAPTAETTPANGGDEDTAPAPRRTLHPAAPQETRKGVLRSEPQRSGPRWHSFLPGMFR